MKKIISIIIIVFIIFPSVSFALLDPNGIEYGNKYMNTFLDSGNIILGLVRHIGIIVSVIALGIMGITYMTKSPEGKAEYKETMGAYIIGAILTFATSSVVNVIYELMKSLE